MTLTIIRTGNNHNLPEQLCMKNTFILTDTCRLVTFFSRKSKVGNPLSYYYDHLRDGSVKTESFRDLFTKSNRSHLI